MTNNTPDITDEPNVPTIEGLQRYDNDYYEGEACISEPTCPSNCKGECGCEACCTAYSDFLSRE